MSLLDKASEDVMVYPEITVLDEMGNEVLRPSPIGYAARATIQPERQSGTSARRAEQDNEGYETEEIYRLRFSRNHDRTYLPLGQGSEIEWNGTRWMLVGFPTQYNGSLRTRHLDYQIKRN